MAVRKVCLSHVRMGGVRGTTEILQLCKNIHVYMLTYKLIIIDMEIEHKEF